jgi:hypothetical protein
MPDYSKDTPEQACERLKKRGGALVGTFNQERFREKLGTKPLDTIKGNYSLGNGYCNGVCLDWIRRVLLSKPNRDQNYLTYSYATLKAGKEPEEGRSLPDLRNRTLDTSLRMANAYYRSNEEISWLPKAGAPQQVKNWEKVAKDLDTDFDQIRQDSKREVSKRHFGNLILLNSKSKTYTKPDAWLGALSDTDEVLSPGRCVLAGFSVGKERGHGIALWVRKQSPTQNDSFYLFDPNLGVFSSNTENLDRALQYLFWRDEEDTPFYANCASKDQQQMQYMIFGPPNVV